MNPCHLDMQISCGVRTDHDASHASHVLQQTRPWLLPRPVPPAHHALCRAFLGGDCFGPILQVTKLSSGKGPLGRWLGGPTPHRLFTKHGKRCSNFCISVVRG